jgi:hypothetical protein
MPLWQMHHYGSTTSLALIPKCCITCEVMNKLVVPKSKKQQNSMLLTCKLIFNKLDASLTLILNPLHKMSLPWVRFKLAFGSLGQSFAMCPNQL